MYGLNSILLFLGVAFTTQSSFAGINLKDCQLNGVSFRCAKDVKYGKHKLQSLDLWLPQQSTAKVSLVVYIHGGGYVEGDKESAYTLAKLDPVAILNGGKAFATLNYRLSGEFPYRKGETGRFPVQMADSAKAIQYLRAYSGNVGVDTEKIAVSGSSAGGGITLWLALHNDLQKKKGNVVSQQSTRTNCIALMDTQPTLNIGEVMDLLGPYGYTPDEGITGLYGLTPEEYNAKPAYWDDVLKKSYEEASPMAHLSSDDHPKILMSYMQGMETGDIHSPEFGIYLGEGIPDDVAAKYKRKSLDDLGISFSFTHSQSMKEMKPKVTQFLLQQCP